MKKSYKYIVLFLSILCFGTFSSCSKDFNPSAEYKEIPIVYGLINISDSVASLKITKAFTVDENIYQLSKDSTKSNYSEHLEVTMIEYLGTWDAKDEVYKIKGKTGVEFNFDKNYIHNKEEGVFYAPTQVVYQTRTKGDKNLKIKEGSDTYLYGLKITNTSTGHIVESDQPIALVEPLRSDEIFPNDIIPLSIKNDEKFKRTFTWETTRNGKRYEAKLRFHYNEMLEGSSTVNEKYQDFSLATLYSKKLLGKEPMSVTIIGANFFSMVKSRFETLPKASRTPKHLQLIITVGGIDITNYIELNKPSSTIVQERPEYTNIKNGIGIFSTRTDNFTGASSRNYTLDMVTLNELRKLGVGF